MKITFKAGDIVDEQADGLVCSGNVELNMSGGVNGELLRRGGQAMQAELHGWLKMQGRLHVEPGFALRIGPEPFAFKTIVYTVAVDGFHDSSIELVCASLANALNILADDGCKTVAVPALATGYGHLTMGDFARALRQCLIARDWPFAEVRVVVRHEDDLAGLRRSYATP